MSSSQGSGPSEKPPGDDTQVAQPASGSNEGVPARSSNEKVDGASPVQEGNAGGPAPTREGGPEPTRGVKRRISRSSAETAEASSLSYEEFRSSLAYFFTLFQRDFAPLEEAARVQYDRLHAGDATTRDDGGNNPLVEMRLDPEFGALLCKSLIGPDGQAPVLRVPRTKEQVAFWKARAKGIPGGQSSAILLALSEAASHLETLKEALRWYMATGGAAPKGTSDKPLSVVILGAAARYEYVAHHGGEPVNWSDLDSISGVLAEALGDAAESVAPGRPAEFLLCGRDVPEGLHGKEQKVRNGEVTVRHQMGYLHDLGEGAAKLRGALFVALHAGLGLKHPELSVSWPGTVQLFAEASPVWLSVTSFNKVEHELAEKTLKEGIPRLSVDHSGVNRCAGLAGTSEISAFDGCQGKRNYCIINARVMPAVPEESDGLFD